MTIELSTNPYLETLASTKPYQQIGVVEDVVGLVIRSKGPSAKVGDICEIHSPIRPGITESKVLKAEVVGFKGGSLLLMPLENMGAIATGCTVINTHKPYMAPVGEGLLGRVLNALGEPIDDLGKLHAPEKRFVQATPPDALTRERIIEKLPLGVRCLDAFTTVGKGQRLGIFAGSGVGKSTMQGMIARYAKADLNVIALIGERGREVREFIEEALGEEGLSRSVVIVATADQPAIVKIKAALLATTIAEAFRDQGADVLFMLDSVTRIAMALREVGLSVGEPPTSRGYTPSVFAFLPGFLERCGTSEHGSITGLYTVLVEGDDFNEPISDAVRGLLDGHIVLSRELAYQNHFPAVDVLASVSRLMLSIATPEHREAAGKLRDLMATYKKSEDIINIGAYVKGANPKLDLAVNLKDRIDGFLKQDIYEASDLDVTLAELFKLAGQ